MNNGLKERALLGSSFEAGTERYSLLESDHAHITNSEDELDIYCYAIHTALNLTEILLRTNSTKSLILIPCAPDGTTTRVDLH